MAKHNPLPTGEAVVRRPLMNPHELPAHAHKACLCPLCLTRQKACEEYLANQLLSSWLFCRLCRQATFDLYTLVSDHGGHITYHPWPSQVRAVLFSLPKNNLQLPSALRNRRLRQIALPSIDSQLHSPRRIPRDWQYQGFDKHLWRPVRR